MWAQYQLTLMVIQRASPDEQALAVIRRLLRVHVDSSWTESMQAHGVGPRLPTQSLCPLKSPRLPGRVLR